MEPRSPEHLTRRELLQVLGSAGLTALAGCTPAGAETAGTLDRLDCVVTPPQTEGPYFVDTRLMRADLRLDPATQAVSAGLPLRLAIAVSRVDGAACAPLPGAMVDVWQCDALGVYSDVRDFNGLFDTRGKQFLRGYQLTDRSGRAEFLTVYPGWYAGRAVHIHFKVRVPAGERAYEFTSQLYFDEAVTDLVHARPPYSGKGTRDTRNDRDGIFRARSSGEALLLRLDPDGTGYRGSIAVGLRLS